MKSSFRKNKTVMLVTLCMLSPMTLFVVVVGSKVWAAHSEAVERANTPKHCQKRHRAGGFTRNSRSMAEMSAIMAWSREVSVYGRDYNFWTNAARRSVRCRRVKGTKLINCIAFGIPCKILHDKAPDIQIAGK